MAIPVSPQQPSRASPHVPVNERVPFLEKMAYGAGAAGDAIATGADNRIYAPIFVVELGLSPAWLSTLSAIERAWDSVCSPLVGWLSDNTQSRWGRRKPYIFFGSFLLCGWLPILFLVNRDWSHPMLFGWLVGWCLFATLFNAIWLIPWQCLLFSITGNSVERTNVTAFRAYFGKVVIFGMGWIWYLIQLPVFNNALGKPDVIVGSRWVMIIAAVLALGLCLLPLFVKERVQPAARKPGAPKQPFFKNIKLALKNRAFGVMILVTLLFVLGQNLTAGMDFYVKLFYIFNGDQKQAAWIAGLASTVTNFVGFLGIPVFQWLARVRGKRFALGCIIGLMISAALSTLACFNPAWPYLSIIPGILAVPGTTGLWMLIPSMNGDIIDHEELQNGVRNEGVIQATYGWFFRVFSTIANLLSGPLIVWVGYNAQINTHQSADTLLAMRILIAVVPLIFLGAALLMLQRYPLTTERIAEIKVDLDRKRATAGQPGA